MGLALVFAGSNTKLIWIGSIHASVGPKLHPFYFVYLLGTFEVPAKLLHVTEFTHFFSAGNLQIIQFHRMATFYVS